MSDRVELPAEILQSVGTREAAIARRGRIKTGAADGRKTSAELFKLYMRHVSRQESHVSEQSSPRVCGRLH